MLWLVLFGFVFLLLELHLDHLLCCGIVGIYGVKLKITSRPVSELVNDWCRMAAVSTSSLITKVFSPQSEWNDKEEWESGREYNLPCTLYSASVRGWGEEYQERMRIMWIHHGTWLCYISDNWVGINTSSWATN